MAGELVLIVEDNDKNLKLARDILQFRGFRTLEAMTGSAAVEIARNSAPDLVLLDIQLPDTDGISVLRQLRDDGSTSAIPVVALTAFAMKDDQSRFIDAGFDGYIAKPIDIKAFPDQVRDFCERGRRQA